MNYIHIKTKIEKYLFLIMINNFLKNAEKYGIILLNQ